MISVGVVSHRDAEESGMAEAYARAIMLVTSGKMKVRCEEMPFVNVVFDIPGKHGDSEFYGFLKGHYSKKNEGVLIAAAIPLSVASSENPKADLLDIMKEAVTVGGKFLESKGHEYRTDEAYKFINYLMNSKDVDDQLSRFRTVKH